MLNALNRAQFDVSDIIRRAQGDVVAALRLGPNECSYQTIASHSYWRLRDYGGEDQSRSLLIVAAPIKRPYIWDLTPATCAICFCLRQGLHVHLFGVDAGFTSRRQLWDRRLRARHRRSRRDDNHRRSRRKAVPDRSFAGWHTRGDIRSFFTPKHQGPCAVRRTALLWAVRESLSRCPCYISSTKPF